MSRYAGPDDDGMTLADQSRTSPAVARPAHHPVVLAHAEKRAADYQLRLADAITRFAGTMTFVYIHVVVFAGWMLVVERSPWPTLTLAVSLEAIFLSTFVMIGQNRQAAFQQEKADHDFVRQEEDLAANTAMTRQIRTLAEAIHANVLRLPTGGEVHDGGTADHGARTQDGSTVADDVAHDGVPDPDGDTR
jgi:uncharacterized membrane protein